MRLFTRNEWLIILVTSLISISAGWVLRDVFAIQGLYVCAHLSFLVAAALFVLEKWSLVRVRSGFQFYAVCFSGLSSTASLYYFSWNRPGIHDERAYDELLYVPALALWVVLLVTSAVMFDKAKNRKGE